MHSVLIWNNEEKQGPVDPSCLPLQ
jgi:hypothetical protein